MIKALNAPCHVEDWSESGVIIDGASWLSITDEIEQISSADVQKLVLELNLEMRGEKKERRHAAPSKVSRTFACPISM